MGRKGQLLRFTGGTNQFQIFFQPGDHGVGIVDVALHDFGFQPLQVSYLDPQVSNFGVGTGNTHGIAQQRGIFPVFPVESSRSHLAVLGFDNTPLCELLEPLMTTIHVPKQAMSQLAVERLLRLVGKNSAVTIKLAVNNTIVKRKSI